MFPAQMVKNRFCSILVVKNFENREMLGMVFWTTFIIGTFDQNTFLLVRKSKKFWENVRIWEKICRFETGTYFSISILFVFFFDSDYLYELFGKPIEPFFRFFVLYGRKLYFGMRSWDQLEKNQKNVSFWNWNLFFNFDFIRVFFRSRLPLRTFWMPYRAIFSIFCLKWQEIAFFSVKYSQILLKLRNSLLKGAKILDIWPKFLRFHDEQERILIIMFKIERC